jgi:hypothetical protein
MGTLALILSSAHVNDLSEGVEKLIHRFPMPRAGKDNTAVEADEGKSWMIKMEPQLTTQSC